MKRRLFPTYCCAFAVLVAAPCIAHAERERFSLERFDTSQLKIWQVLHNEGSGEFFAYVRDPEGYIHRVDVGEYLGLRDGKVTRIDICGVWFTELIANDKGSFEERAQVIRPSGPLPTPCKEGKTRAGPG